MSGFTEVALAGVDDADVRVGPAFSVRAEGAPDVLDRLVVRVAGDRLEIGRRGGWGAAQGSAKLFVTLPRLAAAGVSGTGDMTVAGPVTGRFRADLSGAGDLSVTGLAADEAAVSLAGAGDVTAAGRVGRLRVSVAGTGDVDARQLTAAQADVSVAGTGDVRARVDGPARVSATGTGDVDLGPNARCATSRTGVGSVRCGG